MLSKLLLQNPTVTHQLCQVVVNLSASSDLMLDGLILNIISALSCYSVKLFCKFSPCHLTPARASLDMDMNGSKFLLNPKFSLCVWHPICVQSECRK